jgi:hypothetical protein
MMNPYGYLTNYSNAVTPPLLDLILQNETGDLSEKDRWNPYKSKSSAGAIGGYQLMPKYLHDYGYGMDPYIQADAVNPEKSREIAGELIKGYSGHYGFTNLADTLIGYNMGAKKTSDWIKRGRNIEELPDETKAYLKRAKNYIDQNPDKYNIAKINQQMAEVSNDNIEGNSGMYDYNSPFAEKYYDPIQRKNILFNDDNYIAQQLAFNKANGIVDPVLNDRVAKMNAMDNGVLNQNSMLSEVPTNAGMMSANADTLYGNENLVGQDNNNTPILSTPNYVESPTLMRRRDSQELTKGVTKPNDQIDLNEMLIRIGGAGLANSQLGGNRQIADATSMYGNIMDYNRSQALQKYKIDVANAQKNSKQARADRDYLGNIDQSLADMDKALAGLKSVEGNTFTGVTGLWDGTVGSFIDSMTGDPKATTRLLLKKLKVDDTLLRIAQTKGAISNKEMDLFMSPAPSVGFDQEEIWERWINERKVALQRIKARLTGNMQVIPSQQASQSQIINGIRVTKVTKP